MKVVQKRGKGGFLGEGALALHEPRAAKLVVETKSICMMLCREPFFQLLGPMYEEFIGTITKQNLLSQKIVFQIIIIES